MNLQAALFLARSYTLYLMMLAPSLNSVPGSWPTNITLQTDHWGQEFNSVFLLFFFKWTGKGSKGNKRHTRAIYQPCLSLREGPRWPQRWVFQARRPSVWTEGIWSSEDQYLKQTVGKLQGGEWRKEIHCFLDGLSLCRIWTLKDSSSGLSSRKYASSSVTVRAGTEGRAYERIMKDGAAAQMAWI